MRRDQLRVAILTILAILLFVLIAQNTDMALTRVFFWTVEMPRFVLLGTMFFTGGLIGYMVGRKTRIEPRRAKAGAAPGAGKRTPKDDKS